MLISPIHSRPRMRTAAFNPFTLKIGTAALIGAMAAAIGILSFFYLLKSTEIHTKGYELRKLGIEHDKLVSARESASLEISRNKSLMAIRETAFAVNMVPARNMEFVREARGIASIR